MREVRRILIVDDSMDDRIELRRLLLHDPKNLYEVHEAATGAQGIKACRSENSAPFFCLLLSWRLPDMDGVEALESLRLADGMLPCPVVVTTGVHVEDVARRMVRAGAHDHINKDGLTHSNLLRALDHATERFAVAADLRENIERLSLALHAADAGTWEATPADGAFFASSRTAQLLQVGAGSPLTTARFVDLAVAEDRDALHAAFARSVETGERLNVDYRVPAPDGGIRWLAVQAEVHEVWRGRKLVGILQDVTARKQAEQQRAEAVVAARQASDAKTAFLANMSHEIRTPLNAIIGVAQLLREDGSSASQADHLNLIDQSARHLLDVINQILDISKIEAGKLRLENTAVNVAQLLHNVALMVADKVSAKGLTLVIEADEFSDALQGDPTRLTQALLNYLSNAIKFSERGVIRLRARLADDTAADQVVRFEVEDQGVGVAAEHADKLFSSFEQGDGSYTRRHGGTGLGLAITRRLAMLMGGESGFSSGPGCGSTFWFTARLKHCDAVRVVDVANAASTVSARERLAQEFSGRRVLVVDDEPVGRMIVTRYLESCALEVTAAVDGADAVAQVAADQFDLVLMDMQMPRLDGVSATRQIRAMPNRGRMPILALTANAFSEDRVRCIEAGMNDHLAKPVTREALYQAVFTWLHHSSLN